MSNRFEHKRAIVTGAAQGIGKAAAARLGREGARVLIADQDKKMAYQTVDKLREDGVTCEAFIIDVSQAAQVTAMVKQAVDLWGGVDIQVSDAGIMDREPFLEMSE
nr:SDR family NAD(P)-dependent oxidoreductase [Granulosicoccus sp.]